MSASVDDFAVNQITALARWMSVQADAFENLLAATVRARQALNDRLPNIADGILEAAIDEGYAAVGRDLGDES